MPKSTTGIAQVTNQVFDLLEPLKAEDRQKVITAVQTLFGDTVSGTSGGGNGFSGRAHAGASVQQQGGTTATPRGTGSSAGRPGGELAYFDEKDPQSKIEEYAVAARFREQTTGAHTHTKEDFETTFTNARRNFNDNKYRRDIDNAKTKGLFNRGEGNILSAYGQKYVDALPDRDKAKAVSRPKTTGRRRPGRAKSRATAKTK